MRRPRVSKRREGQRRYFGTIRELREAGAQIQRLQIDLSRDEMERWNYLKDFMGFKTSRDFLNELTKLIIRESEEVPEKVKKKLLSF